MPKATPLTYSTWPPHEAPARLPPTPVASGHRLWPDHRGGGRYLLYAEGDVMPTLNQIPVTRDGVRPSQRLGRLPQLAGSDECPAFFGVA